MIVMNDEVSVLLFHTPWCSSCKLMKPLMLDACAKYGVELREVDAERFADVVKVFDVKAVPTVLFFRRGELVHRVTGAMSISKLDEEFRKVCV